MEWKCCYECLHYVDCLCTMTDEFDNKDPETFFCSDFKQERDEE